MAYACLETPLGPCGLAWSPWGITRLAFGKTPAALQERFRGWGEVEAPAHPHFVRAAMRRLRDHLSGRPRDFADLPLDLLRTVPALAEVARALQAIPAGKTVGLDTLAERTGAGGGIPGLKRLLGRNPVPVLVPGHRALGTDGMLGAWGGGSVMQERLLRLESMVHPPLHDDAGEPIAARVDAALGFLRERDPRLGELIERVGPYRVPLRRGHSPYQALARSIVGQQISGHAARAILARLARQFGTPDVPPPSRIHSATAAELRAAGLSAAKARAMRDLAARALAGGVPSWAVLRRWPDERILAALTAVHGIGQWTVEMLLLFRLGRPDVLPLGDLGIRKGYARTFTRGRLPSARELERRGWRWRPYRSLASWYLWRALELP